MQVTSHTPREGNGYLAKITPDQCQITVPLFKCTLIGSWPQMANNPLHHTAATREIERPRSGRDTIQAEGKRGETYRKMDRPKLLAAKKELDYN